jgi:predicted RNase H-like HicB family nuclease
MYYLDPGETNVPIHEEVLMAARKLCTDRKERTFRAEDVVHALPHLNPSSVRTHVISRCCVNAPKNHPHKWDYFKRVGRGLYEILPAYRSTPVSLRRVRERAAEYGTEAPLRDTIHVVVHRSSGVYVGEGLEVAVVSQGRSLDELVANIRAAIVLHLDGENLRDMGLVRNPRIAVTIEEMVFSDAEA